MVDTWPQGRSLCSACLNDGALRRTAAHNACIDSCGMLLKCSLSSRDKAAGDRVFGSLHGFPRRS